MINRELLHRIDFIKPGKNIYPPSTHSRSVKLRVAVLQRRLVSQRKNRAPISLPRQNSPIFCFFGAKATETLVGVVHSLTTEAFIQL